MTDIIKRYALSTFVTFFSGFSLVLIANLNAVSSNPGGTLTTAFVISLFLAALRAGVKAVSEAVIGGHADLNQFGSTKTPKA